MFSLWEVMVEVLIRCCFAFQLLPGWLTFSWLLLLAVFTTVGVVHCSSSYTDVYEYLRVCRDDPSPPRRRPRRKGKYPTGDFMWPTRRHDLLLRARCTLCALLTLEAVRVPIRACVLGWPYLGVCCGWPDAPLGRSFFALSLYPLWFFDMIELLGCTGAYVPPSVRLSKWWRTPSGGERPALQSACFPSKCEDEVKGDDDGENQEEERRRSWHTKKRNMTSLHDFISCHPTSELTARTTTSSTSHGTSTGVLCFRLSL